MFYYCYKIYLTAGSLRGKYYIGKRIYKGEDPYKDPYKGSGKIIKNYYKRFPNAYQKIILATCTNADELSKLEYKLIGDKWDTDPMCLNLKPGGEGGNYGVKFNSEWKKKLSNSNKGKKHNCPESWRDKVDAHNKQRCRKVAQYDLDGNFIQEYESCTEAAKSVGTDRGAISRVCGGLANTAKGFKWRYV